MKKSSKKSYKDKTVGIVYLGQKGKDNMARAEETKRITAERRYMIGSDEILLPDVDSEETIVISPAEGKRYLGQGLTAYASDSMCRIIVNNMDSFQAGRQYEHPLVLNFANAYAPGGGGYFRSSTQEEVLCRCSTLYASLSSEPAAEMFRYNRKHFSRVDSDYMLLSPNVAVFRDEKEKLLPDPKVMAVLTAPALNRHGRGVLASNKLVEETFLRRMRIMLSVAAQHGYRNLVLGAWGCGVFGNPAEDISSCFHRVIVEECYGKCFNEICFAVYGSEESHNYQVFRAAFA